MINEVMIVTKGMTHVGFIRAPRWVSLYLSKSTGVHDTPKLVGMTRVLSSFLMVRAYSQG